MDIKKMKNMIVLKNLPSNIVEEAFVVLKNDVKVHKLDVLDKKSKIKNDVYEENYAVKEAEFILKEYIDNIEQNKIDKKSKNCKNINKKYERLKALTFFLGMFCLILLFLNFNR